ncbi:hypothetical protein EJ04DRAFT_507092 [Polyplosphaeria fusca]|uniref:F-box domain-containing protein n=1 Tax=Polyplosphaeria fusca TaxID=682080 RepID=A0A9P4RCU1_9PLEO|nr:hypothetical protein EJ04DRAFT_507092 [Polyplosphaeria fusca]
MDDLLPSYESVTHQNPWELVAPHLASKDLCSAALVCQKWHQVFTPQLWGNPASHFGVQNDTVYVALTRFKRTLFYSRLHVRELTHTLHLPPAHAEIYGGPHCEWLRDCLERLPRLQSLIVNGLPFFDHASLLTLRHSSLWWQSSHPSAFPSFGLRLLYASGCTNATSTGLAEALPHFPELVSLDLSRTGAAKDELVLSKLKFLRNLRILKLRALGLRDADLRIVAIAIGTRVRSLDVRDNNLTDKSARLILDFCMKLSHPVTHGSSQARAPAPVEVGLWRTEDLDKHLRKKLTQGFVGSLAVETARTIGITHLYLSQNSFSVEGISGLLRSRHLDVLDVGTLPSSLASTRRLSSQDVEEDNLDLPGVEKLTPMLAESASERLVYLRINYAILTEDSPLENSPSPRAELIGDLAIYTPPEAFELDEQDSHLAELDSSGTAIFELPGDGIEPVELPQSPDSMRKLEKSSDSKIQQHQIGSTDVEDRSPAHDGPPLIEITSEPEKVNRGPAFAPEPVFPGEAPLSPVSPAIPTMDASGGLSPIARTFDNGTAGLSTYGEKVETVAGRSRHDSMYYVDDRRARLDLRQNQENRLHPGALPNLQTLVLTDVPTHTQDDQTASRLIQFIKDCAEEAEIARLRASHTYMLPPGRSRSVAEREYARSLFGLRRIVLEMAPPQVAPKKISTSWRQYPTKSSTEDWDSEAFWQAASQDFSFFGDEECGLPNLEPGRGLPLAAMSGLMLAPHRPAPPPRPREPETLLPRVYDVVAEIARFRKDRKAMFQVCLDAGEIDPAIEGNWLGDITVIRPSNESGAGDVDYYGNRYESGWLYR